jgi:hypothetical protein
MGCDVVRREAWCDGIYLRSVLEGMSSSRRFD